MTSTDSAIVTGSLLARELEARQSRLRPAEMVMEPAVLGAARLTRYSFSRMLLRRAATHRWTIARTSLELDDHGRGVVVYEVAAGPDVYSFVAVTTTIDEADHTDRVIADRWEIAAVLVDGAVDDARLEQLRAKIPNQERGRFDPSVLVLTRGNRSVRFFQYLVDRLAAGRQPEPNDVADSGYIMRSTAFYGNGKFGMRSFEGYDSDHPLRAPYRAQFLAAWLFRELSYDVVEHCARVQGGAAAVGFDDEWSRYFGLGNATGLGLVPYAFQHPEVLHAWVSIREIALADVRAMPGSLALTEALSFWIGRARAHFDTGADDGCAPFLNARELVPVIDRTDVAWQQLRDERRPFDALFRWAEADGPETAELVVSLLIELHDGDEDLVDDLLRVDETVDLDPALTIGELKHMCTERFSWIDRLDLDAPDADVYWWVISDNTDEPRRVRRDRLEPRQHDVAIDVALRVRRLGQALGGWADDSLVADLIRQQPEHALAARRVVGSDKRYCEPRDNACAMGYLPLQLQRFQLAFYGMDNFKPKSTDWLRVTLFQGAPRITDLGTDAMTDVWVLPPRPPEETAR
jgi:hypothetical protein